MTFGLRCLGEAGNVQFDADSTPLVEVASGFVEHSGQYDPSNVFTLQRRRYFVPISEITDIVAIRLPQRSQDNHLTVIPGPNTTYYREFAIAATSVTPSTTTWGPLYYKVFRKKITAGTGWGLNVYRSDGSVAFATDEKVASIISYANIQTNQASQGINITNSSLYDYVYLPPSWPFLIEYFASSGNSGACFANYQVFYRNGPDSLANERELTQTANLGPNGWADLNRTINTLFGYPSWHDAFYTTPSTGTTDSIFVLA